MTLSVDIDPDSGVLLLTAQGTFAVEGILECIREAWGHPGSGGAVLWDVTEASAALTGEEVRKIAAFVLAEQGDHSPSRLALVASKDLEFGLLRMYEVFRQQEGVPTKVFRSRADALTWLAKASEAPEAGAE